MLEPRTRGLDESREPRQPRAIRTHRRPPRPRATGPRAWPELAPRPAAIALPLGLPAPASAKILKASASQRKEAAEKAREYKFSKPLYDPEDPNQGTPEFLANARRRSDYESGTTLRDGKGATRDPITGEDLSKRRTYVQAIKDGDDLCATPGACGRTGRWQNKQ